MNPYNIYIEGNIASGKSTLIEYLKSKLGDKIEFYLEPIDKWKDCKGVNLLELMYQDPKQYSFLLQSFIQSTMFEIQIKNSEFPIKLTERSLLSERYVFIQHLISNKLISELEFNILNHWFEQLNSLTPKVNEIIYLRTKPEEVFHQLKIRDRIEEKNITIGYLSDLHRLHEDWLIDKKIGSLNESLVTVIEQNFVTENTNLIYNEIVERLESKLKNV
jgi:deoxynucleoside kinase